MCRMSLTEFRSVGIPAICTVLMLVTAGCRESLDTPASERPPADSSDTLAPSAEDAAAAGDSPSAADTSPAPAGSMSSMPVPAPEDMVFKDDVATNADVPDGLDGLTFVDTNGERVALKDFMGKKNVILVFTEGFAGMLCPFCKTQTSRLVANYDRFAELDTEVLVVYPGERDHLDEFVEAARTSGRQQVDRVPFPIVLDPKMTAVDYFDIRSKLAHPSTYVIDKQGNVRLAYVGADMSADRPSIQALLNTLEAAGGKGAN